VMFIVVKEENRNRREQNKSTQPMNKKGGTVVYFDE